MSNESNGDPYAQQRFMLRAVGIVVTGIGLIFMVAGVVSFFSSFNSFEPPQYFWCCFVGMPLLGIGAAMCQYGFLGAYTRYVSTETRPAIKSVVSAISEGLAPRNADRLCPRCHTSNEADARFCKQCGAPLSS